MTRLLFIAIDGHKQATCLPNMSLYEFSYLMCVVGIKRKTQRYSLMHVIMS